MSSQRTVALEGLFERHRGAIVAAFRAIGASADDADDLTGEVFSRAVSGFGRLENVEKASAWLFGIVRNVRLEYLRRRRPVAEPPDQVTDGGDPVNEQLVHERRQAVRQAVAALEGGFRQVVELRYGQGLAYAEIAEQMQTSVQSVGVTLHRAREKLRGQLTKYI